MILKSKGFSLRPFKKGDEKGIVENADNYNVWINLTNHFPHPYTMEEAKKWIKTNKSEEKKKTTFAIIINKKVVGGIGIELGSDVIEGVGELGYWLGERYWGKGIMTDAVKIIVDYGFKVLGLRRIEAKVFSWNPASVKVLKNAGFSREGIMKKRALKDGKVCDEFLYAKVR